MKRMALLLTAVLYGAIALSPQTVAAPPPGKMARIGYLVLSPLLETPSPERVGFLRGMRELGYVEGKNLTIEYRSADGATDMLPFLADELVELGVDVIVAPAGPPLLAAKEATSKIPVVMMFSADPVSAGLVQSLARPGGNVTGMSMQNVELAAKRLELLKEAVPRISRVAVIWDSSNVLVHREWEMTQRIARGLGITIESEDVGGEPDLSRAFERIKAKRPDALIAIIDLRIARYRQIIPDFALAERIPLMAGLTAFTQAGGLMSYAPDFSELSRRSAGFVDKLLNGADPATLPVQQPTTFDLVINMKTARSLGLRIPDSILLRADQVIK
jgi:putative ABC transport system substrate-binding protein